MNRNTILKMLGLLVIALMTVGAVAVAQTTYYVDVTNGDDVANNGLSPTTAFRTITKAMGLAGLAHGDIIMVATGTYAPTGSGGFETSPINVTKAVSFVGYIPTGSSFTSVTFAANLDLTINPANSGTVAMGVTGQPWTVRSVTLEKGTWQVSSAVTIASGSTITRKAGSIGGTAPTFGANISLDYVSPGSPGSLVAGLEVPASLGDGTITSSRAQFEVLIFPATLPAITIGGNGGNAIQITGDGDVTFNNNVTITSNSVTSGTPSNITNSGAGTLTFNGTVSFTPTVANPSGRIVNSSTTGGNIVFNGDVTFTLGNGVGGNGNIIENSGSGSILFASTTTLAVNKNTTLTSSGGLDANETATVLFSGTGAGTIRLPRVTNTGAIVVSGGSTTRRVFLSLNNTNTSTTGGIIEVGSTAGDSEILGNITTTAIGSLATKLRLNGNVILRARATSNGILTVGANSQVNLQTYTLTINHLSGESPTHQINGRVTGTGKVSFISSSSTATGTITIGTLGAGRLPNVEVGTNVTIVCNLAGANAITGSVSFSSTGTGRLQFTADATVNGDVTLSTGTLSVDDTKTLTVLGNFTQTSGTFDGSTDLATNTHTGSLELKGNFNRTGGTYNSRAGTLKFSGASAQTFNAGANLETGSLVIATTNNAPVTFQASVIIRANGTFSILTGVADLGVYNVRMQTGASVNNASGYISSGGAIIFEGTGGGNISGAGLFSNLDIRVGAGNTVTATSNIDLSGVLTLRSGTLALGAFTLQLKDDYVRSTVRKSSVDADAAQITVTTGAFTVESGTTYNFEIFGNEDAAAAEVSASGWVPTQLYNLTIATGDNFTQYTTTLPAAPITIEGAVRVNYRQILNLNGQNLTASGDVTHSIIGSMTNGNFIITGNNVTVQGDYTALDGVNVSACALPTVVINPSSPSTSSITFVRIRSMSGLTHSNGNTSLTMGGLPGELSTTLTNRTIAGNLTMTAGTLTLGSWIQVTTGGVTHSGGTIAIGSNRLVFNSAGTYTLNNTGTYTGTGAVELQQGTVIGTPSPSGGTVPFPNLRVNGNVTLGSNVEVSNQFVHQSGTLTLGTNNLIVSGNTYSDLNNGTVTGTGSVVLTGTAMSFYLGATSASPTPNAYSITNLEVNTTGYIQFIATGTSTSATATVGATSASDRMLDVTSSFTFTSGEIRLGPNDLRVAAFTRAAGTITADAGFADDASNEDGINRGELVLNGGNFTPGPGFTVPNLRVNANTAVQGANNFTVTGFFQVGQGGITRGGTGYIVIADGATIIRDGTGAIGTANPTFSGAYSVIYTTSGAGYTTGRELAGGTLTNLIVNTMGIYSGVGGSGHTITLEVNRTVTVNGQLGLISGTFDNTTSSGTSVTMASGATVAVTADGVLTANGTQTNPLDKTNSRLVYSGPIKLNLTSYPGQTTTTLQTRANYWPSSATISELTVSAGDGVNGTPMVVQLTRARTVQSLVVNMGTPDSQFFLGDDGAVLGPRNLTVTGNTTISNGRVTTEDAGAGTSISTLALQGNLTMTGGVIGGTATGEQGLNLSFTGTGNQTVSLSSNQTVGQVTINQTGTNSTVTVTGANLALTGNLVLINGVVLTGATNSIVLPSGVQGFDRSGLTGVSHVAGRVTKAVVLGRNEFPTGSATQYRPVALTFATNPGVNVTISHVDTKPTGIVGLPIADGVSPGVDIARYAPFFWNISSNISLGSTQFNLELTAAGFTDFDDVANIRIIRRAGSAADVGNQWRLQGVNYDNFVAAGVPTVVNVNSTGGIIPEGAIFTYGLKSNMVVANPFTIPTLTDAAPTFRRYLRNPALITGNTGALSFTASAANPAIVDVSLSNDTLIVTRKVTGTTTVTVVATDAADGSRISYTTTVNVISKVETIAGAVPTEFSLEQNFPNPFNPSTTIRFALPKEAPVTLVIYNMLGVPVRTLINGEQLGAANHQVTWDGKDDAGMTVPSGMYLYRITAGSFQATRKMTLLK